MNINLYLYKSKLFQKGKFTNGHSFKDYQTTIRSLNQKAYLQIPARKTEPPTTPVNRTY